MQLVFIQQNIAALKKFSQDIGNVKQEFENDPRESIVYLRGICKFACAECGKDKITGPILKFFNFEPDTICYDCQKLKYNTI